MSQFAPVAPIQILEELQRRDPIDLFGTYHLFLAHHTATHASRFQKLIANIHTKAPYKRATLIMDNSIVELGNSVDDNMIHAAVDAITYISSMDTVIPCLPDVMGDGPGTVELAVDAYHRWNDRQMPGDGYMLVTQGKNWDEFVELVDHFFITDADKYKAITWVGIPRVLTHALGSRRNPIEYIRMVAPHVNIHLLGFSDNMTDDFWCAKLPNVRGIDSAVPVRFSPLMRPTTFVPSRDPSWMDTGVLTDFGAKNIRNVRRWVGTPVTVGSI